MAANTGITADKVKSVYSGLDGKCCCGCSGKHYINDESNKKMVGKVLGIINEATELDWAEGEYAATVVGKRVYIAYF